MMAAGNWTGGSPSFIEAVASNSCADVFAMVAVHVGLPNAAVICSTDPVVVGTVLTFVPGVVTTSSITATASAPAPPVSSGGMRVLVCTVDVVPCPVASVSSIALVDVFDPSSLGITSSSIIDVFSWGFASVLLLYFLGYGIAAGVSVIRKL